ncbi:hypothetical protein KIN20_015063, partial [Parelaphostrongylus tenuis]
FDNSEAEDQIIDDVAETIRNILDHTEEQKTDVIQKQAKTFRSAGLKRISFEIEKAAGEIGLKRIIH